MTTLDKVRALFQQGNIIECVENTYIPKRNGTRRKITRAGPTVCDCVGLDGELKGKPYRQELPTRAGDVLAVDAESVTYRLGRGDHTVTLRLSQESKA